MTARPKMLLLDTNVWLDFFFGDRPGSREAARLFELVAERGVALLYAMTTTKDVYYLAAARLKAAARQAAGGALSGDETLAAEAAAFACVQSMSECGTAVGLDASDMWVALRQRRVHRDYEDDLVVAAAMRAGADWLVTSDEELRSHCMVAALSVADTCRMLEVP